MVVKPSRLVPTPLNYRITWLGMISGGVIAAILTELAK